ncbi:hypothetical protein [Streptomyces sp. NPDC002559]
MFAPLPDTLVDCAVRSGPGGFIGAGGEGARGIVRGLGLGLGLGKEYSYLFNVVNVKEDVTFLDGQFGCAGPGVCRNYEFLGTGQ